MVVAVISFLCLESMQPGFLTVISPETLKVLEEGVGGRPTCSKPCQFLNKKRLKTKLVGVAKRQFKGRTKKYYTYLD